MLFVINMSDFGRKEKTNSKQNIKYYFPCFAVVKFFSFVKIHSDYLRVPFSVINPNLNSRSYLFFFLL